jgi:hypothetical protein
MPGVARRKRHWTKHLPLRGVRGIASLEPVTVHLFHNRRNGRKTLQSQRISALISLDHTDTAYGHGRRAGHGGQAMEELALLASRATGWCRLHGDRTLLAVLSPFVEKASVHSLLRDDWKKCEVRSYTRDFAVNRFAFGHLRGSGGSGGSGLWRRCDSANWK